MPRPASERIQHRVLIVDDDPEYARAVSEWIADTDISVDWRSDPTEALALAGRERFEAAVVDLIMPGLDGLQLAEELRRTPGRPEVILLTGHPDLQSAVAGLRQGLFDYLQKPSLRAAQLRQAVRAAIARRLADPEAR